jgi:hypothetical protein
MSRLLTATCIVSVFNMACIVGILIYIILN